MRYSVTVPARFGAPQRFSAVFCSRAVSWPGSVRRWPTRSAAACGQVILPRQVAGRTSCRRAMLASVSPGTANTTPRSGTTNTCPGRSALPCAMLFAAASAATLTP